jgi:hypothetical protein
MLRSQATGFVHTWVIGTTDGLSNIEPVLYHDCDFVGALNAESLRDCAASQLQLSL